MNFARESRASAFQNLTADKNEQWLEISGNTVLATDALSRRNERFLGAQCDIVPSTVAHFKWRLGVRMRTKILEYLSILECLFRVCIGFLRIKIFFPVFLECWKI